MLEGMEILGLDQAQLLPDGPVLIEALTPLNPQGEDPGLAGLNRAQRDDLMHRAVLILDQLG